MNKTQYGLELRKPTYTDPVEIGDLNYNMDIIDHAIKKVNDKLDAVDPEMIEKIQETASSINGVLEQLSQYEDLPGTLSQHEEDIDGLKNEITELGDSIPTDEHINALINSALGVIEDAYY